MRSALPRPVSTLPQAGEWLTPAELDPPYLTQDGSLVAAVDLFQSNPELRLLPVVNHDHRPVGAIFEKDVRRLLLNPYGHALLRNPAYGHSIRSHVRACPAAEAGLGIGDLIDVYRAANGTEGMILTRGGRLHAAVNNRRLIHLAAEREMARARTGIERAQRIERASEAFEHHVRALTNAMGELAQQLESNAETTASRAGDVGERAVAVATAASQTSVNIGEIADRGRELARAFGQIGHNTSEAENAAAEAVALVGAGSARARDLLASAHSIDAVIALIGEIAGQVNLLALNATIEAARAGEAGKGFTVVANEVKQLSTQTGRAAATITAHVREIRHGIGEVAAGHAEVERAITAIAARSAEIQTAVGTQAVATATIARNVEEAVEASTGIHRDVEAIGGTSREASGSALEMGGLAHRLQRDAHALSGQVQAFLEEISAL